MRIGDSSSSEQVNATNSKVKDTAAAGSTERNAATGAAGSGDVISTSRGQELVHLAFELGAASRQGRVEQVRSQVESGTYQVDPRDVSRGILLEALTGFPLTS